MAQAKRTIENQTVTEKQAVEEVTLTLSREEAEVLYIVTGNISGPQETKGRKAVSSVYYALSRAGIRLNRTLNVKLSGNLRVQA